MSTVILYVWMVQKQSDMSQRQVSLGFDPKLQRSPAVNQLSSCGAEFWMQEFAVCSTCLSSSQYACPGVLGLYSWGMQLRRVPLYNMSVALCSQEISGGERGDTEGHRWDALIQHWWLGCLFPLRKFFISVTDTGLLQFVPQCCQLFEFVLDVPCWRLERRSRLPTVMLILPERRGFDLRSWRCKSFIWASSSSQFVPAALSVLSNPKLCYEHPKLKSVYVHILIHSSLNKHTCTPSS